MFMKIPAGIQIKEGNNKDYVLKMHRNIYGQRQAGRVWSKHLHKILTDELKFQQSEVDECVYYRDEVLYLLYTDDSILASRCKFKISKAIKDIQLSGLKITVEGDLNDFLGVHIEKKAEGEIHMTQHQLAKSIVDDLGFKSNTKVRRIQDENIGQTRRLRAL